MSKSTGDELLAEALDNPQVVANFHAQFALARDVVKRHGLTVAPQDAPQDAPQTQPAIKHALRPMTRKSTRKVSA